MYQVMIEYYGNNDYRDYLAHHGIKGMAWGRRNGPPYPLAAGDHSAAEKRAGWRSSLSSGSRGDLKRRQRNSGTADVENAESARKTLSERLAERKEKKIDAKKQKIADEAVRSESMDSLRKSSRSDLFTTEELKEIASRIDERSERRELIASKSRSKSELGKKRDVSDVDIRKQELADQAVKSGDASKLFMSKDIDSFSTKELNDIANEIEARNKAYDRLGVRTNKLAGILGVASGEYSRRRAIDKAKAAKILRNADKYSIAELREATERFAAKEQLKQAKREARLGAIESLVKKGASITKNVSDIATSVSNTKKAMDALAGKTTATSSDAITKILNSGKKEDILKLHELGLIEGSNMKTALTNMANRDRLDGMVNTSQISKASTSGITDSGNINQQREKPAQSAQSSQTSNVQNGSKSTGVDMDEFWRASAEKYDPSIAIRRKTDSTPMTVKNSRAMDKEISKYTQMTSGSMRKVAEGISRLQVMGTDWKKGGYSSPEEAAAVRQQNKAVKESQQRISAAKANQQEQSRVGDAIKTYTNKVASEKRAETRARNKAQEAQRAAQEAQKQAKKAAQKEAKKADDAFRRAALGLSSNEDSLYDPNYFPEPTPKKKKR